MMNILQEKDKRKEERGRMTILIPRITKEKRELLVWMKRKKHKAL